MKTRRTSSGVRSDFLHDAEEGVSITFFDSAYVRSDLILIDPSDRSVHAVLYGASHYIGTLCHDLAQAFVESREVLLVASHMNGDEVKLTTPISVAVS